MILAHRIRLCPNNRQASVLLRAVGTARFAWNWGLARWQEMYKAGEKPNARKIDIEINARKKMDFGWMNSAVGKWPAQGAMDDLQAAFNNFFRRIRNGEKPGYPKFKKKGRCKESFYIAGAHVKLDDCKVRLPRLGWVKMAQSVRLPGRAISARFSRHAGHWYVSINIEIDDSWVYPHRCENQAVVGVDLGVVRLAVPSKGEPTDTPRALRFYEKRLRRQQKELARRQRGGANYKKTQLKIQKTHEKVANIRKDAAHKLTSGLVKDFRYIGIEDLNIRGMQKNKYLAKSVADAAMGEIRRQLEYKAELSGSTIVVADRFFPSSKLCSVCGYKLKKLDLSQRTWVCPECGTKHDRDFNAAKNLENIAVGYTVNACGEEGSGGRQKPNVKPASMRQESSALTMGFKP